MVGRLVGAVFRLDIQELLLGQNHTTTLPVTFYPCHKQKLVTKEVNSPSHWLYDHSTLAILPGSGRCYHKCWLQENTSFTAIQRSESFF